ncbi:MAG: DNA-protecting protein DprA [Flavobacteriales bacterium]|nr:DNA-protecting protein DprA [Flavobacteriales bacterium]
MQLHPDDQVIVMLTAHLPGGGQAQPLAAGEWSRLSDWLTAKALHPGDLLVGDPASRLASFQDRSITVDRIQILLDRGFQTSLLLDKWHRAGIWMLTRASPGYPARLVEKLAGQAPPLFYGAGDRKKLDTKALAVVGSRNAGPEDLQYARLLGHAAAAQGWSVVSGGARGVDEASMRGAIEARGTVIGVVSDSLLKTATSSKYRDAIQRSDIVLLSSFHPEAGFRGANAMARNKYVYCLSRAAVVVCTDRNKGGTWAGATEDLRKKWVRVWVRHHPDSSSGNRALLEHGALALPNADPHLLQMEDLEQDSLDPRELFQKHPNEVHEPLPPLITTGMSEPEAPSGPILRSPQHDEEIVLEALATPMTLGALAKHLEMAEDRIAQILEHLVQLHKVEPPIGRRKSYKRAEPDLFS